MALSIVQSPEREGNYIRGLYVNLLGRSPDGSPNYWFTQMQQGTTDQTILTGIISSDEYFTRLAPLHNTQPQEQTWISQVYVDLLGHAISSSDLSFWMNAQEHGMSRLFITEQITNSAAYRTRLITNLFESYLGRAPSANDLNVYQNYLLQGGTDEGMKAVILGSSEYFFGTGGGTAYGFLDATYRRVLGRPLDSAGVQFWGGKLAAGEDRTALAAEMIGTFDAEAVLVQNYYAATLKRAADSAGLSYWAGQLTAGFKDEYVLAELAATDEYFARF
jgi:hypothetical protein